MGVIHRRDGQEYFIISIMVYMKLSEHKFLFALAIIFVLFLIQQYLSLVVFPDITPEVSVSENNGSSRDILPLTVEEERWIEEMASREIKPLTATDERLIKEMASREIEPLSPDEMRLLTSSSPE